MTITVAPLHFLSKTESSAYIAECEARFRRCVIDVAEQLHAVPGLQLVGLSGPTCAGKTTTANILDGRLEALGRRIHTISVDDFFREQPQKQAKQASAEGKPIDFDSIDALDLELFVACLSELMQTGHAVLPIYDLSSGRRVGTRELVAERESDIFLVEGIQVVYPEISTLLRQYNYRSIYCDVRSSLQAGETVISPEQIRLMRRLVRDYHFRAADAAFTFYLWESVRANEIKSILPNVSACDIHLDTLMPYELGMLRPYLEKILGELPRDSVYLSRVQEILASLPELAPLTSDQLPDEALYREFVPVQK